MKKVPISNYQRGNTKESIRLVPFGFRPGHLVCAGVALLADRAWLHVPAVCVFRTFVTESAEALEFTIK